MQSHPPHKCNRCGYNKHPQILNAHHIDHNRENNSLENLELLCPTCHNEHHFLTKSGSWTNSTNRP